ncbi:hypothetical protein ACFOPQ_19545 [Deinococcus antarcticus]|uniref:Uncharacterized protein n=1 Tax=Deinococcus antarcticus TaxID=1298767 RepID=A0ABV8AED6_9DEIO
MIELVPFDETHREVLERLQLPAEQQEFTDVIRVWTAWRWAG